MANDYTTTSEHYLPVPAITDKVSYSRDRDSIPERINKGMVGLAAYDSNADNYLLAAGNAGTLLSSSDAAPRGRVAPLVAGADATLLFQDNTGAALTDKWVAGYDDSSGGFAIHNAATIPATLNDALMSLSSTQVMFSLGDAGAAAHTSADDFVFELGGAGGLSIVSPSGTASRVWLGDADDTDSLRITWNATTNEAEIGSQAASSTLALRSAGTDALVFDSSQDAVFAGNVRLDDGYLTLDEEATAAPAPTANVQAQIYIHNNSFVIRWNQGGTSRFLHILLTGTGTTWTHDTVGP